MDATYWQKRCEAAEDALRRARSRIWISPERLQLLSMLADLKPGEMLTTGEIAQRLQLSHSGALASLRKLDGAGLVQRSSGRGCHHRPIRWRLGHLVHIAGLEGLDA